MPDTDRAARGARPRPPNLYGIDRDGLASALAPWTERGFHAAQLYHWMYGRQETRPSVMSDLPARLRAALEERFRIFWPEVLEVRRSADGSKKYALRLEDGCEVEAVYILYGRRVTFCLSSQVGCPLACRFCLTGTMGLVRNLTPGEIVGQAAVLARDNGIDPAGARVVFMGMGEPLNNYDAVLRAFRLLVDPRGFALPPRRVTLSTAGLVPGIERLAAESPRPRLAVSLAAADDALRDRLVPINRRYDLAALIDACRRFPLGPRERVTFEYVLLAGVNDRSRDAARIAHLLRGLRAKINVIPYNEAGASGFRTPAPERAARFREALLARGVPSTIRWSRGRDIGAACGQLARGSAPARA
ncbi:MAG: 23S rRNA (adenine(2503)-C(2))-methyltransferase RlmN [Acidobacteriota bacterium]